MHDALQILDDRFGKIHHTELKRFVKRYLGGDDLEQLFKFYEPREKRAPEPDKGVSISYGEGHIHSLADAEGNFTANVPKVEIDIESSGGPTITYGEGHVHPKQ